MFIEEWQQKQGEVNINLIDKFSLTIQRWYIFILKHYTGYFKNFDIIQDVLGVSSPVSWGIKIDWLHLSRGVSSPSPHPGYDTKPSDDEAPILELWWMWSTHSLPLLLGPLWPEMVVPIRVLSMGLTELFNDLLYLKLFNCVQTNDWYWIGLG